LKSPSPYDWCGGCCGVCASAGSVSRTVARHIAMRFMSAPRSAEDR